MKWLILFSIVVSINVSFAADESPTLPPTNTESKPVISDQAKEMTSSENRKNLKYQIAYGFIGYEYVSSRESTLSAGYFLTPDDLLILRYTHRKGDERDKAYVTVKAVTAGYRHFVGNSFNIMPTVYYRRNTADYYQEGSFFSIGNDNLVYEDIGLGFRIGNEWQFTHVTIGCDWFGLNHTLIELNKHEDGLGIINDITLQKALTMTLLSFYVGYSF